MAKSTGFWVRNHFLRISVVHDYAYSKIHYYHVSVSDTAMDPQGVLTTSKVSTEVCRSFLANHIVLNSAYLPTILSSSWKVLLIMSNDWNMLDR